MEYETWSSRHVGEVLPNYNLEYFFGSSVNKNIFSFTTNFFSELNLYPTRQSVKFTIL